MEQTLEEMMNEALEGNTGSRRKLSFSEQCGAFAALYNGQMRLIVARAFGLSLPSTSHISGCLEYDPEPHHVEIGRYDASPKFDHLQYGRRENKTVLRDHNRNRSPSRARHYQEVAREFEALGPEEFTLRYYTEQVHKRILRAKAEIAEERRVGRRTSKNPDFSRMNNRQFQAWRDANPDEYRRLFPAPEEIK